jgi:UDP-GlcNAc:undecaprenyl-phosphate GlcNAc-1-phosphate transferase
MSSSFARRWQFLGNMLVAFVIIAAGIHIDYVDDPLGSGLVQLAFPVAVAFTFFWIVGMNVALNFIDGLDGLAAGVAAIAATTLGAIALLPQINEPFVAWMAFSLAGANPRVPDLQLPPGPRVHGHERCRLRRDDACGAVDLRQREGRRRPSRPRRSIIDTFYVLLRRVLSGQPPFAPDRGHFHHRLLDVGLSHPQAVLLIYAVTFGFGALALLTSGRTQALAFIARCCCSGSWWSPSPSARQRPRS